MATLVLIQFFWGTPAAALAACWIGGMEHILSKY